MTENYLVEKDVLMKSLKAAGAFKFGNKKKNKDKDKEKD